MEEIFDGFPDWENTSKEELAVIKELAGRLQCEIWLEAKVHREGDELDGRGVPLRLMRLQLLKDHGNPDVADVHIELDPRTLLMVWR